MKFFSIEYAFQLIILHFLSCKTVILANIFCFLVTICHNSFPGFFLFFHRKTIILSIFLFAIIVLLFYYYFIIVL